MRLRAKVKPARRVDGALVDAAEEGGTSSAPRRAGISIGMIAKLNRKKLDIQRKMAERSIQAQHGWWHSEDFKIHQVMRTRKFWNGIWHHLAFPAMWLWSRKALAERVKSLEARPSTAKFARDAAQKARDFLVSHLILTFSLFAWHFAERNVQNEGSAWYDMYSSGQLVQNMSLVLPVLVYVFFHSGISSIVTAHHAILFRRRTAMPPTLLFEDLEGSMYADEVYDDDMLIKTLKGFRGYEQWEESFETFYLSEVLSAAAAAKTDPQPSPASDSNHAGVGAHTQRCDDDFHHKWRQRMIGNPNSQSVARICAWLETIQRKARGGKYWNLTWLLLTMFNAVHVLWPIATVALEVRAGHRLGVSAVLLCVPQSVVSGYLWNNALRLSVLAVMHFSRLRNVYREMTLLVATELRHPSELLELDRRSGPEEAERLVLDEGSLRDWWRLRVLLCAAISTFSSVYWLHFSCMLMGNVALLAFVMPYVGLRGNDLQMRYVVPVALNLLAICLTVGGVLFFCLGANDETARLTKALTARKIEVWLNPGSTGEPRTQTEDALTRLVHQLSQNPTGEQKMFGLIPVRLNVVVKMMGFLASGPVAFLYSFFLRTRQERALAGQAFF